MIKNKLFSVFLIIIILSAIYFAVLLYKRAGFFDVNTHQDILNEYSVKFNVDPLLVKALMKRESNINADAVSNKGAIGLMQIMPKTAQEIAEQLNIENYNIDMLKEPEINIMFGTYYLSKLLSYYNNNLILSLAAYNAGIGNVDAWYAQNPKVAKRICAIPFKETKRHTRGIILTYIMYKGADKLKSLINKTPTK